MVKLIIKGEDVKGNNLKLFVESENVEEGLIKVIEKLNNGEVNYISELVDSDGNVYIE